MSTITIEVPDIRAGLSETEREVMVEHAKKELEHELRTLQYAAEIEELEKLPEEAWIDIPVKGNYDEN